MPTLRRQVEITNEPGLHLRAADRFVRLSQQFPVEIQVFCNGLAANGRSILDLLCLAAGCGARLELEVSGPDPEEAPPPSASSSRPGSTRLRMCGVNPPIYDSLSDRANEHRHRVGG